MEEPSNAALSVVSNCILSEEVIKVSVTKLASDLRSIVRS